MARRLTVGQREVLSREQIMGVCIRYQWSWIADGVPVTREVKALMKRGLMDASYYSGGRAAAHITAAGKAMLGDRS
jgi:hypothetical protein